MKQRYKWMDDGEHRIRNVVPGRKRKADNNSRRRRKLGNKLGNRSLFFCWRSIINRPPCRVVGGALVVIATCCCCCCCCCCWAMDPPAPPTPPVLFGSFFFGWEMEIGADLSRLTIGRWLENVDIAGTPPGRWFTWFQAGTGLIFFYLPSFAVFQKGVT